MPPKPPKVYMPPKPPKSNLGICSRILRPMQKTKPICWFLAVIVVMFYSQRSRRVIMEASKTWDGRISVIKLFRNLLYERYLTVGNEPTNSEEYKTFNEDTFIEILQQLYDMDSSKFPYNPRYNKPNHANYYLCQLYTLLGVDYKMFEIVLLRGRESVYYSSLNKEYDGYDGIDNSRIAIYKDDGYAPSILLIANHYHQDYIPYPNNEIKDSNVKEKLSNFIEKEGTYNGFRYSLDSVILMNTNLQSCNHCNHYIVGMTCKQKRFIFGHYMGTRKFPCQLIPYNWNIQKDRDIYLSANDCEIHDTPQPNSSDLSFNFSEGNFIFIYVRKNASRDTSSSKESDVAKYLETRAISRERRETARLEEQMALIERERKEVARLEEQMALIERERKKIEAVRLSDDLVAIMKNLTVNDREIHKLTDTKRKRSDRSRSGNGSHPPPKKQDRRASPKKAKRKRNVNV